MRARGRSIPAPAWSGILQLAANDNMRVAYCTTAAQYFHVLRRQAALLWDAPRPLVLMTPEGPAQSGQAAGRLLAVRPDRRRVPAGAGRPAPARAGRECDAAGPLHRQGLCRPGRPRRLRGGGQCRRRPDRRAVSVPLRRSCDEVIGGLPEPARSGLASGRAAQHGRVGLCLVAHPRAAAARRGAVLCRPAQSRQPVGRLRRAAMRSSRTAFWPPPSAKPREAKST